MSANALVAEREHLAKLLEAVQRCVYFLHAGSSKLAWPLDGAGPKLRQKDEALFQALAALNDRFAKLQTSPPRLATASAQLRISSRERGGDVLKLRGKIGRAHV